MKKYVLELFDFELFFFKRNNFSKFSFFSKKMLVDAFPEKTFGETNSYR